MHISSAGARFDTRKIIRFAIIVVPCLLMVLLAIPSNPPQQQARAATGEILRCSESSTGVEGNGGSKGASISADGRYVAFQSFSNNFLTADANGGFADVFRKDLDTGELRLCSADSAGNQGDSGSGSPSISADGRYVAFHSSAGNLVAGDDNGKADVFRKELETGITVRCSVSSTDGQVDGDSKYPAISGDGRYVAFESIATNLVANDTNNKKDIFKKDMETGAIQRSSVDVSSNEGNGDSSKATISSNGDYVAFLSSASNLFPGDDNGKADIFRKRASTGEISLCSCAASGEKGNDDSAYPSISSDGKYIAFDSLATNLVAGDANSLKDVFRKDLVSGDIVICSTDSSGHMITENGALCPAISGDGLFVAFESGSPELISGHRSCVFRKEITTGEIVCCSSPARGSGESNFSHAAAISYDGRYVALDSSAYNLVPNDKNNMDDVFRKKPEHEVPYISTIRIYNSPGQLITLEGMRFGDYQNDSYVSFGGNEVRECISWSDREIKCIIPLSLREGVKVTVTTFGGTSNTMQLDIFLRNPSIEKVEPDSAIIGAEVKIVGSDFLIPQDNSKVFFGSYEVKEYLYWSNTEIRVKVPYGSYVSDSTPIESVGVYVRTEAGASNEVEFKLQRHNYCLAEGYTGTGFQEYLCIGNANGQAAEVVIYYLLPDNYYWDQKVTVPANSRVTVDANAEVPDMEVSAYIVSNIEIVVERPMYFNYNGRWTGGHDAVASRYMGKNWFFAEGYTGPGFDEWVCVLNMGDVDTNLTFHFQTQEEGEVVRTAVVPKASRGSFKVNDLLGPNYQCSLWLESDQFVVAERSMYFDYMGASAGHWEGGHCVMGVTHLSKEYYFAEGTTRAGFEEWLTIQNPDDHEISVSATFQMQAGQGDPVSKTYKVGPGQRATAFVPKEAGMEKDVSIKLTSDSYFLAERPMYFRYMDAWEGGHCVIGAMQPSSDWFFAEGYTGDGFHEWLCLQNPGTKESTVEVTYLVQGSGPLAPKTVKVGAGSRVTIAVNFNAGTGLSLSTQLRVTSGPAIVAERPMYFDFNGWDGGHDVVGYAPELASSLSYQSADSSGAALIPGIDGLSWKKK